MAYEIALPISVVRPEDLLLLRFHFYGLKLQQSGGTWNLVKAAGYNKFLIVMQFPPQSIGEQSFFESAGMTAQPPPGRPPDPAAVEPAIPAGALLSGSSWLVFDVGNQASIPYTVEGLLAACRVGTLKISPEARKPALPSDLIEAVNQGSMFTAIEAPYGLQLSPEAGTTWAWKLQPGLNQAGTRAELWHATMQGQEVRAVWATDLQPGELVNLPDHAYTPFLMSLTKRDRLELIRLSTDAQSYAHTIPTEQLMLSTLGAWLKAHSIWDLTGAPGLSVTEWKHIMTLGRDHYVRVIYQGYLFPTGNLASLVKVTERKFQRIAEDNEAQRAAYLRTRLYVLVRQPERNYTHNALPFKHITLKTLVTPTLDPPVQSANIDICNRGQGAFWLKAGGEYVMFHVVAVDREDRQVEFTLPLAFVDNAVANGVSSAKQIVKVYDALGAQVTLGSECAGDSVQSTDERRTRPVGGQVFAYTPPGSSGGTALETTTIVLGARYEANPPAKQPKFLPVLTSAEVDIPAVKQLLGTSKPCSIGYVEAYRDATPGQFGNPAEIFAKVLGPKPDVKFAADRSGGLARPDFAIDGLSRSLGPVSQVGNMLQGQFKPQEIFPNITLLGGIKLSDIINDVPFSAPPSNGEGVPQLVTFEESGQQVARYRWYVKKTFEEDDPNVNKAELITTELFKPKVGAEFELLSEVRRPLDGSPGSFLARGILTNFDIVLLPGAELVALQFNSVKFTACDGQKLDVAVDLKGIQFRGMLKFVNELMKYVPLDGFVDPPSLNIDASGVALDYTLAIPNVAIGVFSLSNLSLSACFYLPFLNDPANVRLAFCSRENPCALIVTLFGGGAFFAVRFDLQGVKEVEMALEFGGGFSLNLGVACGAVTVMGGVYFQKSGDQWQLAAYIRLVGVVSVLGLISVCIEFYLALEYLAEPDKLYGVASMKVKVKVLFFSKTVSLEVRREFKGADPFFRDVMALPDWQAYCAAFGD